MIARFGNAFVWAIRIPIRLCSFSDYWSCILLRPYFEKSRGFCCQTRVRVRVVALLRYGDGRRESRLLSSRPHLPPTAFAVRTATRRRSRSRWWRVVTNNAIPAGYRMRARDAATAVRPNTPLYVVVRARLSVNVVSVNLRECRDCFPFFLRDVCVFPIRAHPRFDRSTFHTWCLCPLFSNSGEFNFVFYIVSSDLFI